MTWSVVQQRWDGVKWAYVDHVWHTFFKRRAERRARELGKAYRARWQPGMERYRYRIEKSS